jgi:hypothetical protein
MKKLFYILIFTYTSLSTQGQSLDSICAYDTLISRKYSDYREIGSPKGFISYLIDSKHDLAICGLRYKDAVIFTLELKSGMRGDKAISEIKDLIYAPQKCYYVETNCYKLVNQKDTIGAEYIVFKKKGIFTRDKILKIYKANRETSKFELMGSDCFTDCLIYNEMSKFNIRKSKSGYKTSYFE